MTRRVQAFARNPVLYFLEGEAIRTDMAVRSKILGTGHYVPERVLSNSLPIPFR